MQKRNILFLILFTAYALVMGHGIVPHHHEDEDHAIAHHDEDHDHDQPGDLAHSFSHFIHASHTFAAGVQLNFHSVVQKPVFKSTFTGDLSFADHSFEVYVPNWHHPPPRSENPVDQTSFFSRSLRAPPAC